MATADHQAVWPQFRVIKSFAAALMATIHLQAAAEEATCKSAFGFKAVLMT